MIEASEGIRTGGFWQMTVAVLGTLATYLWGGWDAVLSALMVLVCIDYATGFVAAALGGRLDSSVGARGIARKVAMFMVVAVANIIDNTGGLGEPVMRTIVCWWYAANEGLSIIENVGELGAPVPTKLRDALARLRDEGGGHDADSD